MENKEVIKLLQEVVGLLSVQVKRGTTQKDLILELSQAGFQPKRIAGIAGTTPNTVSVALSQIKSKKTIKK